MMNFKIKSTAGTENFTATADLFVEQNWNKSALLLTFVATDKSKCRPHRAVEQKSNNHGIKKQKYNLGGRMKMKYPRERSARVGLTVPKGQTRKPDNNGVW